MDEDFCVIVVELPDFPGARSEVPECFTVEFDSAFGGGEHLDGDVRGEGDGDFVEIEDAEKDGDVRAADGVVTETTVYFAEDDASFVLVELVGKAAFQVLPDFAVQRGSAEHWNQFTVDQFVFFGFAGGQVGEVFDGHQSFGAYEEPFPFYDSLIGDEKKTRKSLCVRRDERRCRVH